ncbi:6-hydroxymethylpterin diphosphokinase MptE-like protein [Paenibacillus sp. CF384]|uniref:motility associated factor glycosyltransferase family protein n=1 Tax=Paenibacillus sp. CF384 TaxID=1884382 RepID=UPI0008946561|nr:6-hydroxymethylpterin diphosphokinase MptE-like protein [Paenibacillus sp. CF384]SDX28551.1 Uncharacterized conserved protein [Paenibacillus sp. CF384]
MHDQNIEMLEEVKVFLPRLIQFCYTVSELLYVPITEQTWSDFSELVQGMDDLYRTVHAIGNELESSEENTLLLTIITNFTDQLILKFEEMNRLMDEEEFVQAGDCIKYELAGLFHAFAIKLGEGKEDVVTRFSANLAFLEKNYHRAFELIKNINPDRSRYHITYASNGSPNIYMRTSDNKMKHLYSNYEPEHEARRWVESMEEALAGKTNLVVYGMGLGYHLLELARKHPKLNLIIFEPDEQVLLAAMQVIDFEELFKQLQVQIFVVGEDKVVRGRTFFHFVRLARGESAVTSLPSYDKVDAQRKLEFFKDAQDALLHFELSSKTGAYYGIQLLQNRLYNLAHIVNTPSIRDLKDKLKGQAAVIVGAGPSLEKDIETLRQLKKHALIIAAGTSVQSLSHFGITPHLVVSVDFGESNGTAFSHLDLSEVPLLYAPQIKYTVIEDKKKLIHFLLENDWTYRNIVGWEDEEPIFCTTPSVTGPAIEAAIYMGCTEIILTGQDLSYPTDQTYAPGAKHISQEESEAMAIHAHLQVENVQGGMNRTNQMMQVTLSEIEKFLSNNTHVNFINTSQLGAKIKHTEFSPMESVLQRLSDIDVPNDLLERAMETYLRPFDEPRKSEITNRLFQMPMKYDDIEKILKRIEQKIGLLPALSRTKPEKCHKTMVDIEELWETVVDDEMFAATVAFVIPNDFRSYDRDLPELVEEKNIIRKADLFSKILGTLIIAILECLPMVNAIAKEAVRRVEAYDREKVSQ